MTGACTYSNTLQPAVTFPENRTEQVEGVTRSTLWIAGKYIIRLPEAVSLYIRRAWRLETINGLTSQWLNATKVASEMFRKEFRGPSYIIA